ncbi:hypothetical protein PG994_001202 [Apiospora phragmitis]|uniref:Uncharacterized protein n=1 Tax=Apiospora phragmitis TaxID=2905665 RepID=A0ABR1WST7_9PEZI
MQFSFLSFALVAQLSLALANPVITPAASLKNRQSLEDRDIIGMGPRDQYDQSSLPGYCTSNLLCYHGCFQMIVPSGKCLGCPGCDPL